MQTHQVRKVSTKESDKLNRAILEVQQLNKIITDEGMQYLNRQPPSVIEANVYSKPNSENPALMHNYFNSNRNRHQRKMSINTIDNDQQKQNINESEDMESRVVNLKSLKGRAVDHYVLEQSPVEDVIKRNKLDRPPIKVIDLNRIPSSSYNNK